MFVLVFQLLQPIIKSDHPSLKLAHSRLGRVFELTHLLHMRILTFDHQSDFPVQSLFVLSELLRPL